MYLVNYRLKLLSWITMLMILAGGCSAMPGSDQSGPAIEDIQTSSKVLAISDCIPTSLTITSKVTDPGGVAGVEVWYRVGQDQKFTSAKMSAAGDQYTATIKAADIPGGEYGVFEFYIVAQDQAGNQSKSGTDQSVELSRCVG